jgi:hypothetical protein
MAWLVISAGVAYFCIFPFNPPWWVWTVYGVFTLVVSASPHLRSRKTSKAPVSQAEQDMKALLNSLDYGERQILDIYKSKKRNVLPLRGYPDAEALRQKGILIEVGGQLMISPVAQKILSTPSPPLKTTERTSKVDPLPPPSSQP